MDAHHLGLASGNWRKLSLAEQLGNICSEVSRARRWEKRDKRLFDQAVIRCLELLDLTLQDPRWRRRLKEIARAREFLCAAWLGQPVFETNLSDLDKYFLQFALFARMAH